MDHAALNTELTTDPMALGYAALIESGSDGGLADLLNAPGQGTINISSIPKGQFTIGIAVALLRFAGLTSEIQAKWSRVIDATLAQDAIDVGLASVQALFAAAVADGVLLQDEVDALGQRPGSRAEVLFGAGASVSQADVSLALRGQQ